MRRTENSSVTVIVPTLNEEKNIAEVIGELKHIGFSDILIVDGNSTDRTVAIAKKFGVDVIDQNGKGKGNALRQAFNYDGLNGDVVVMMDADGSMSPKEIPKFFDALVSDVDMVKGSRFLPSGYSEDMNLIRRIGNQFLLALVNWLWSTRYTDLCYGFAAFRRDILKKLCPHLKSTYFEIETEIFIKARKLGLKVAEVPSIEYRRKHGKSNLSTFTDGFRILKTIIEELVREP